MQISKPLDKLEIGCLLFAQIWLILSVYAKYLEYQVDFPLGWDPPLNVFYARLAVTDPIGTAITYGHPHIYWILVGLIGVLLRSFKIAEIITPVVLASSLLYINRTLTLKVTNGSKVASIITSILSVSSLSSLWMISNLHEQLLAYVLIMLTILWLPSSYRHTMIYKILASSSFITSLLVALVTPFSYAVLALCVMLIIFATKSKHLLAFLGLSVGVSSTLLIPLLWIYLTSSPYGLAAFSLGFEGELASLETFLVYAGGIPFLFPFSIVGVLWLFWNWRRTADIRSLAVIALTITTITLSFSPLINPLSPSSWRALLLLPSPILVASGVHVLGVKRWRFLILIRKLKFCFVTSRTIQIFAIGVISTLSLNFFIPNFNSRERPFIDSSTQLNLVAVNSHLSKNYGKPPVFIFYGAYSTDFIFSYRTYIAMEIGKHYGYYGQIKDFLNNVSPENLEFSVLSGNRERQQASRLYWEMKAERIIDSIFRENAPYPIVLFFPFYSEKIPDFVKPFKVFDNVYIFTIGDIRRQVTEHFISE